MIQPVTLYDVSIFLQSVIDAFAPQIFLGFVIMLVFYIVRNTQKVAKLRNVR